MVKRQVDDMQELLGDDWSHIGVGRDDGKEAGEYSAIFFQKYVISWPFVTYKKAQVVKSL